MTDHVNADPSAVKQLARSLEHYQQEIKDASKRAQQAINRANWNDGQKRQFEDTFKNFQRQTDSFVGSKVKDYIRTLNTLASDLERARSHRFG